MFLHKKENEWPWGEYGPCNQPYWTAEATPPQWMKDFDIFGQRGEGRWKFHIFLKDCLCSLKVWFRWSSHHGSAKMNLTGIHEDTGSIPALTQWVKDSMLLWLWCRPVAAAPIGPLAREPPSAVGAALKIQKKMYIYDLGDMQSQLRGYRTESSFFQSDW